MGEHTASHTPLPWHYRASGNGFIIRSKTAQGPIAGVNGNRPIEDAEANAALIVTAVNTSLAVADLVKALEPFARIPLMFTDDIDDSATVFEYEGGAITLGHLRRVHTALSRFRELEKGNG